MVTLLHNICTFQLHARSLQVYFLYNECATDKVMNAAELFIYI